MLRAVAASGGLAAGVALVGRCCSDGTGADPALLPAAALNQRGGIPQSLKNWRTVRGSDGWAQTQTDARHR